MKFNKDITKQKWFAYTIATCSAVVLYLVLTHLSYYLGAVSGFFKVISPIVMGIVITYLLSPICAFFEKRISSHVKKESMRRPLAVVITLVLVVAVIVVLFIAFIPQLLESIAFLFSHMYLYIDRLGIWIKDLSKSAEGMNIDIDSIWENVMGFLYGFLEELPSKVNGFVSTGVAVGASVTNFLLGFFIAIYLLMDEKRMVGGIKRLMRALLPTKKYHTIAVFWRRCNSIMLQYLGLDILDGFVVGIINAVFMMVLRMPYAVLISVIVGVTNLAPTFGPIIGGAIGAFILVLVKPWDALIFIIFTVLLQTLDGYVIKPKLFGSSLGVPAVWILISIIVGGKFFGVPGILLAIPFASIINFLYEDVISVKIEQMRQEQIEKGKEDQARFLAEMEAEKEKEKEKKAE